MVQSVGDFFIFAANQTNMKNNLVLLLLLLSLFLSCSDDDSQTIPPESDVFPRKIIDINVTN